MHVGGMAFGGDANHIVMREKFVLHIAESLDPAAAVPLLCAGITTWSPPQEWKIGTCQKVSVVGLGGLCSITIKLAHGLGARAVVILCGPEAMLVYRCSFDFILDTVAAPHDLDAFLTLLNCVLLLENAGLHARQSGGSGRLQRRHRRARGLRDACIHVVRAARAGCQLRSARVS